MTMKKNLFQTDFEKVFTEKHFSDKVNFLFVLAAPTVNFIRVSNHSNDTNPVPILPFTSYCWHELNPKQIANKWT